jgi:small-conductance mechanosensitive channel
MPFDSFTDDPIIQRIIAVSVFGGFVVLAVLLRIVTTLLARRLGRGGAHAVAPSVIRAVRNTGVLFLFFLGVFLGLAALPDADEWRDEITTAWAVVSTALVVMASVSVVRVVTRWYAVAVAPRTASNFDDRMLPLARRFAIITIYGIGTLVILDALGVSISPILGGLGISGLAVALALQPTLSNFFAGTQVLSDGAITVGDYIELSNGPAGYVIDVGWRSTKIRTWMNNLVIIPNSVMSETIITNYSGPDVAMNILVSSGVSYDSDLERVEAVSLEVARQVIADRDEAVKSMDPYFAFDSFGDSNINFWLFLQAKDRWGSFVVTNELIKRLQARFRDEGIEINYPMRKVVFDTPPTGPAAAGS